MISKLLASHVDHALLLRLGGLFRGVHHGLAPLPEPRQLAPKGAAQGDGEERDPVEKTPTNEMLGVFQAKNGDKSR